MKRLITALVALLLLATACSDKNNDKNPVGPATTSGLAVVSTGGDGEANIAVIDYINNTTYNDLLPVAGTCELAQRDGLAYLIDKDGDRIIKFDPVALSPVAELSMGPGSAPESIAFLSDTKAYVTLSDSTVVKIINPATMTVLGSIDIAAMADSDGDPDQGNAVIKDGRLYVSLRRSTGRSLSDHSSIAVIDTDTDTVTGEIILTTNGIAGASKQSLGGPVNGSSVAQGTIYAYIIGSVSDPADGAIEALNPTAMTTTVLFTEQAIGGNLSNWVFDTPTSGWAIAGLSTSSGGDGWGLSRFDLIAGSFTPVSSFQNSYYSWAVDYGVDGLVLVGSQDEENPGVWVFDSTNAYEPTTQTPLDVGLLPKRLIVIR